MIDPTPATTSATAYQRAVVGIVAYSRTVACTRYAKDADKAPLMASRVAIMRMSAAAVTGYERVVQAAAVTGIDADAEAHRFVGALGDFDERLRPSDWPERLVKTYLAFGMLIDFGMALADSLPEPLRGALVDELADERLGGLASRELVPAIDADTQLAARLGLWGRRVVGEEMGTLQRLLVLHPELTTGAAGAELLHEVLSQGAMSRMRGLGLRG
ncbi:ferritin-like fold-containing protein [Actinomyces trachealis]|uniref:ferritin-like fold-containing protein n=1 Tax=Actinomyces trachealis TaxID=2763540 RepID=UPI001892CBCA|nr:ferritin-like fold-containing protein [Actinomyces trachealis]